MKYNEILFVSGGIDSYVCWEKTNRPHAIFIDYGQPYLDIEENAIDILYGDKVEKIKISPLPELKQVHVPARNLMFCTIGVRFSDTIYLAGVKDELCSDKSPAAFRNISKILSDHSGFKVIVHSPLWGYTKSQAIAEYIKLGFDTKKLLQTVSCYSKNICNNCDSCFRRVIALACNNIVDRSRVPTDEIIIENIRKIHTMPKSRVLDIIRGLKNIGIPLKICKIDDYNNDKFSIVVSDLSEMQRQSILQKLGGKPGLILENIIPG